MSNNRLKFRNFSFDCHSDNAWAAWYLSMIHRLNGYQDFRFFLMPYYRDSAETTLYKDGSIITISINKSVTSCREIGVVNKEIKENV